MFKEENLRNLISQMNFTFFSKGVYKIKPEKFLELLKEDKAILLDVRTKEEKEQIEFKFAKNIELKEIFRVIDGEITLPKDKLIVTFCTGKIRSTIAYLILASSGYEVKFLDASIEEFSSFFKPGKLKNFI